MVEHPIADRRPASTQVERLAGEIDIATVPRLERRFSTLPNTVATVIVDLSDVTFLDSAAIQFLHDLHGRLETRAAELIVVSPPATMPRRVLELTSFGSRVRVSDSLSAARASAGQ
jgi:anti-anti-sigma factor